MDRIWGMLPDRHWQRESTVGVKSSLKACGVTLALQGTMIWSSPVQPYSIKLLATLPQMHLAFTVDLKGTVKVWNCQDEDALATFTVSKACFSLEAFLTKDGPFLMVSEPYTKQNACCPDRCCGLVTVTSQSAFLESSLSHTLRVTGMI